MKYQFSPGTARRIFNVAGLVVLLTGLTTAGVIWRVSDAEPLANPAAPLATSDSQKQSREIEIYYGKTGVLFERWSEEAAALSHGRPLAKTIAVTSALLAFTCVFIASRVQG